MKDFFDTPIDRRGKNSAKWGSAFIGCGAEERLPFWVADTDFRAPDAVNEALARCVEHGIYGYTMPPEGCAQAAADWQKRRHGFTACPEWAVFIAGIDCALAMAVQAFTKPGDKILINSPVYTPFFEVAEKNGREIIDSPMVLREGHYQFDFDDFTQKARQAKIWMFCNPQNPTARCMTREELETLANICVENELLIVSDEIHADVIFGKGRHIPIASLSEAIGARTVTCTSASKTFSVAGLTTSVIFIADETLRTAFKQAMERNHVNTNILGLVAMQAAYENGDAYADALVQYLEENRDFAVEYFHRHISQIKPIIPEATFLLWLDCSGLGLPREQLEEFFTGAGVRLCGGMAYLEPTGQFARLNFGCARSVLEQGLERIKHAAQALQVSAWQKEQGGERFEAL